MRSHFRSLTSSLSRFAAVLAIVCAVPLVAATSSHNFFTNNSQWSTTAQNDRLAAINTDATSGFLDVYTGAQPANGNATVTGTLLCSFALGSTAFHAPSTGTMGSNGALTCTAGNTGTAGYAILYKSNHTTVLWMGSVGTSSANLTLVTTSITSGVILTLADAAFVLSDVAAPSGL